MQRKDIPSAAFLPQTQDLSTVAQTTRQQRDLYAWKHKVGGHRTPGGCPGGPGDCGHSPVNSGSVWEQELARRERAGGGYVDKATSPSARNDLHTQGHSTDAGWRDGAVMSRCHLPQDRIEDDTPGGSQGRGAGVLRGQAAPAAWVQTRGGLGRHRGDAWPSGWSVPRATWELACGNRGRQCNPPPRPPG